MGKAIVTYKIMPKDAEVDMEKVQSDVLAILSKHTQGETRQELEPLAFGLKALKLTFVIDEDEGDLDALEEEVSALETVGGVDVVDMRRALG